MESAIGNQSVTFLSFTIGNERCAVEVRHVLEVLRKAEITPVPRTRDYIEGITSFRGEVITVVNLAKKLGIGISESKKQFVIILRLNLSNDKITIGALAEGVQHVFGLQTGRIEPVPDFGNYYNPDYLLGVVKVRDKYSILLDVEKIFSDDEIKLIANSNVE